MSDAPASRPATITDEHIASLLEMTEALQAPARGGPEQVLYHGTRGDWLGTEVLWEDAVGVMLAEAPEGVTLPEHHHLRPWPCRERLIVLEGALQVVSGGVVSVFLPGDCAEFAPHQEHVVTTLEPTRLLCVTVPAEYSYPHTRAAGEPDGGG